MDLQRQKLLSRISKLIGSVGGRANTGIASVGVEYRHFEWHLVQEGIITIIWIGRFDTDEEDVIIRDAIWVKSSQPGLISPV